MAMGGPLTQVFTTTEMGGADDSASLSTLSMSIGAPGDEAVIANTPTTTARRTKRCGRTKIAKQGGNEPQLRKGARCCVQRKHINLLVLPGQPGRDVLDQNPNQNYLFYGTYVGPRANKIVAIKFDMFPMDAGPVLLARPQIHRVLRQGEEMPPFYRHGGDEDVQDELDVPEAKNKMKAHNYSQESIDNWLKLDNTTKKAARFWVHKYAKGPEDAIAWQILAEKEQIISYPMEEQAMVALRLSKKHKQPSAEMNPPASTLDATGEDTCGEDESNAAAAPPTASAGEKESVYFSAVSSDKERPAASPAAGAYKDAAYLRTKGCAQRCHDGK